MKIAFVTYDGLPELSEDDQLLLPYFDTKDFSYKIVDWENMNVNWQSFDIVVLRSCWNYHKKSIKFQSWIESLENLQVNLWNLPYTIKWNMHKKYILELEDRITIVPTLVISSENEENVIQRIQEKLWDEVIIKPAISASSFMTHKTTLIDLKADLSSVNNMLKHSEVLIQPFMAEISSGEWSIVFFDGKYSHATLKIPKQGEFRSQSEFGGSIKIERPPQVVISQLTELLESLIEIPLYCRADGLIINDEFVLMELELIEPHLFLNTSTTGLESFILAIKQKILEKHML